MSTQSHRLQLNQKQVGMTLTEVLVAVSISTTLLLVITSAVVQFYTYNQHIVAQSRAIEIAERGVSLITRELRMMEYAHDGTYPLRERSDNSISFFADINNSGIPETVTYTLTEEGDFMRYVYYATGTPVSFSYAEPDEESIVASNVRNSSESRSIFRYTDKEGQSAIGETSLSDIRYLEIVLLINVAPYKLASSTEVRTSVAPRNFPFDI